MTVDERSGLVSGEPFLTIDEVARRLAAHPPFVFVDLGGRDGAVVEIGPEGWRVTTECPAYFWRPPGFGKLPEPKPDGNIEDFRRLLQLEDEAWLLVVAFILNCLKPDGPYLALFVEGPQGSGKSLRCEMIKRVVDPNALAKMRLPATDHDLMIQAGQFFLLVFDNVSGMKGELSDALCTLATGGGVAVRMLYTDNSLVVLNYCRPFIINGIAEFASRPDLMERAIPLILPEMGAGERRTEAELWAEFELSLPGILGCFFDAIACALRNQATTASPAGIRMVDAARWIAAAEPSLGLASGVLADAIRAAQGTAMAERVENDVLVIVLERLLQKGPLDLTIGKLFEAISDNFIRGAGGTWNYRSIPSTPAHLSKALKRLKPALLKVGIHVEFGDRHREGRRIRIWRDGQEGQTPHEPETRPGF